MISPQKRRRNAVKWRRFLESAKLVASYPGQIRHYNVVKSEYIIREEYTDISYPYTPSRLNHEIHIRNI